MTDSNSERKPKGLKPGRGGVCLPGAGPGRPKGLPNKITKTAKENIEAVYAGLGGIQAHIEFLKKHPRALADFYATVYPRLLPAKIEASGENGKPLNVLLEVVHVRATEVPGGNGGNGNGDKHA